MMSSQLIFLLITILILLLIDVSRAHTKLRLCRLLCCGDNEHLDLKLACDRRCNESKSNHSVGGVCELRNNKDQLRGCNTDFTCAVTCRNECDSVGREDDEDVIGFGSGDDLTHVNPTLHAPYTIPHASRTVLHVSHTGDSENLPLDTNDSSWQLTDLHIILIITAVCLCFLIISMLLSFAIRFAVNEKKLASPLNRGQYPTAVFYTPGKMTTISQGSMFNQPSSDFPTAWCA